MELPTKKSDRVGPQRTCVGCRRTAAASTLLRFVAVAQGEGDALTQSRLAPGRGAWICAATAVECFEAAVTKRAFARALRSKISAASIDGVRESLATERR